MKAVGKLLKWYFLEISESPVFFGVMGGLLIFSLNFAFTVAPYIPSAKAMPLFDGALSLLPVYIVILTFVNLVVVRLKVTISKINQNEIILVYDENDNPFFYCKPLWGRYICRIIRLPEGWTNALKEYFYEMRAVIIVKSNNQKVVLPFYIGLKFDRPLKAIDLDNLISRQGPRLVNEIDNHYYYFFDKCVSDIFTNCNTTGVKGREVQELVGNWIASRPNERMTILEKIEKAVYMPELFNGLQIKIQLLTLGVRKIEN